MASALLGRSRRARRLRVAAAAVVVLLLGALLTALIVDRETAPGSADGGQLVALRDGALHVESAGPRNAPAIVLLHGLAESASFYDRVVPLLDHRYRVVRVDLLGHGHSAKPSSGYNIAREGEALNELIGRLGLCRPVLVGHSRGGLVAAAAASKDHTGVRGLVLVDVPPRPSTVSLPLVARMGTWPVVGEILHVITPDAIVRQQLSKALAARHQVPDAFVRSYRAMTYQSYKQSNRTGYRFTERQPLDEVLGRLRVKPLVIFGAEDRIVAGSALDIWRRVPSAHVRVIPDAGHDPPWEQPAVTSSLIARYARSRPFAQDRACVGAVAR